MNGLSERNEPCAASLERAPSDSWHFGGIFGGCSFLEGQGAPARLGGREVCTWTEEPAGCLCWEERILP